MRMNARAASLSSEHIGRRRCSNAAKPCPCPTTPVDQRTSEQQLQAAVDHVAAEAAPDQRLDVLGERVFRDRMLVAQGIEVGLCVSTRHGPRATPRGLDDGAVRERCGEEGRLQDVGAEQAG